MSRLTLDLKPTHTLRVSLRSDYGAMLLMSEAGPTLRMHLLSAVIVGDARVSADESNRLTRGTDGGLYVPNSLVPDPLAYYILAKT